MAKGNNSQGKDKKKAKGNPKKEYQGNTDCARVFGDEKEMKAPDQTFAAMNYRIAQIPRIAFFDTFSAFQAWRSLSLFTFVALPPVLYVLCIKRFF